MNKSSFFLMSEKKHHEAFKSKVFLIQRVTYAAMYSGHFKSLGYVACRIITTNRGYCMHNAASHEKKKKKKKKKNTKPRACCFITFKFLTEISKSNNNSIFLFDDH